MHAAGDVALDNRGEVRQRFPGRGGEEANQADLPLAVRAVLRGGRSGAAVLRGRFAFVAVVPSSGRILACRDALGIRPLFFRSLGRGFRASSDPLSLRDDGESPLTIDPRGILTQALFLQGARSESFLGVQQLGAGEVLDLRLQGPRRETFWSAQGDRPLRRPDPRQAVGELRELLQRSVEDGLDAEGRVASHCSGGMDSPTVSYFAARSSRVSRPLFASFSFRDLPECSEVAYAREVAADVGAEVLEAETEGRWPWKGLFLPSDPRPSAFVAQEETDRWLLAELQRRGVTVLLGGLGGDHLFRGPRVAASALGALLRFEPSDLLEATKRLLGLSLRGAAFDLWSTLKMFFPASWRRTAQAHYPWIRTEALDLCGASDAAVRFTNMSRVDRLDVARRFSQSGFSTATTSVHYFDRLSAGYGIETRYPLMDLRLVEYVLGLHPALLLPGGRPKGLLRAAMRGLLPDSIVDRLPKQSFLSWYRQGALRERSALEALLIDSRLAAAGLVDIGVLRREVERYYALSGSEAGVPLFMNTLLTERWVRDLERHGLATLVT